MPRNRLLKPTPIASGILPDLPCACATVRRAARLVTQLYGDHLHNSQLEATQFSLLSMIKNRPGKSQVVIGKVLGLDKTTLSRNLRLLRKNCWVASAAVDGQRERGFYLTPAGAKVFETAVPLWHRAQAQLRSAMRPAEWKLVFESMRILTRAVNESRQSKGDVQ